MVEFSDIARLSLAEMVENEGVVIPPHLMSVLQQNEYESVDELRADIASKDEEERDAIWEKADRCALMRALFPYKNPDGTTSKIGRKVTGWLASDLRVSGQQVRTDQPVPDCTQGRGLWSGTAVCHSEGTR